MIRRGREGKVEKRLTGCQTAFGLERVSLTPMPRREKVEWSQQKGGGGGRKERWQMQSQPERRPTTTTENYRETLSILPEKRGGNDHL